MYSPQELATIHGQLQTFCNKSLVLLGGSYWYGGAQENSDLDFYVILRWYQWLKYRRLKKNLLKFKNRYPTASLMIIPHILYKTEWYYVSGVDTEGKVYCQYRRKFFLRQTLKLSWQSYLASKISEPKTNILKCAQSLAGAYIAYSHQDIQPIMKPQNLITSLISSQAPDFLRKFLEVKYQNSKLLSDAEINAYQEQCHQLLLNLTEQVLKNSRFSIISYLVYNFRFLRRPNLNFIFGDPDVNILKKCAINVNNLDNLEPFYKKIKLIAFPVIVI